MKSTLGFLLASFITLLLCQTTFAQNEPASPSYISQGTYHGQSKALSDIPAMTQKEFDELALKLRKRKENNKSLKYRSYPFAETAFPKTIDPVWQTDMGNSVSPKAPLVNFDGQTSPYYPPDCNGIAGPNHYMQTINTVYAIYNKTGTLVAGPTNLNQLFGSVPGATYNDGDPIILYDEQADRWLVTEFSISGSTNYLLVAVSTTNNPTGTWHQYSFVVPSMPDYPKFGIWRDGYYVGVNNSSANDIYVLERTPMLTGGTAQIVSFNNNWRPITNDGFVCVPPIDNDGTFAPTGTPGLFIAINDDAIGGGSDELWIYELAVNWTTPSASTFNRTQQIAVAPFDSNFGNNWSNIVQPGTTQKVDAIPQVVMNVPQYRNFGTYQTIVCCHTVDVDATNHAGVRWYELRKTTGNWTIRQQGTYAPDANSRWMGSVMLNANGKIGLGYSISSSTVYPGIRYTGQTSGAYANATGLMDAPEEIIWTGTNSQTGADRWGDYALMCVDPTDNETFWFTTQYIGSGGSRKTRIASFKIGNSPTAVTTAATSITATGATLNGTVNPNGLATNYYFQWGTTIAYGNTTTSTAAGSGTSNINVNFPLAGLTSGVTYHFRVVAVNNDGTANGADMTFTPGGAVLTTTAASAITLTTASSGGNITSDGGSPVTARGVCWATTANPLVTGNHTTDGSGTGTFVSSITGLSANTTYHVRAYATNANGTFYGEDLTFTTLCGIYTLPFNETFSGTTIPTCWSQIDNQGNGQIWQFGTITGQSPNPNLTGNYAFLNSDAYGSGSSQNADLITPTLDMTSFTGITLQFNHYFKSYSGSSGKVYYSTNNGSTWTLIATFTTTSTTNPATFNQSIAALAGQSAVKFKWNYTGSYGYYWAIDNVQVTGIGGNTLTVTPSNQNVTLAAGSTNFAVTCSTSWAASSDATWCTVTPSGSGNGTLVANYTANTGPARTANITVTASGAPNVVVTVTQAGVAPSLSVTPANQNVTAPAGNTSFTVTSNSAWTVTSDATWCTVTPSGTGNGSIAATYTENTAITARVANITVTVTGLTPVVVTVTQAGAAPTLSVSPNNQTVPASPASQVIYQVTSNTTWTASSNATWCTVTPSGSGSASLTATYTENTSLTQRIATITVTVTGLTPVTVTLTQLGAPPTLAVTPANQDVSAAAGNTSFTVTSNSAWTSVSDATWCTVTPSGNGNGSITATFTENTSTNWRVANITVTVVGISPVIVTVTQAGAGASLSVSPSNQNVTAVAGTTSFTVSSNSAWEASSAAAWCSVTPSGFGNGTIAANYQSNPNASPRTAIITVTVIGLTPVTVTVSQDGAAPTLGVSPESQTVSYETGTTSFNVTSNANWTTSSDAAWCTTTQSGSLNGSFDALYEENPTSSTRVANITVNAAGTITQVVQVIQLGFVGIELTEGSVISLYPNPSTGLFTVASPNGKAFDLKATITDATGQLVLIKSGTGLSSYAFDLSHKARGNYFVKVETSGKTLVWKLVKN